MERLEQKSSGVVTINETNKILNYAPGTKASRKEAKLTDDGQDHEKFINKLIKQLEFINNSVYERTIQQPQNLILTNSQKTATYVKKAMSMLFRTSFENNVEDFGLEMIENFSTWPIDVAEMLKDTSDMSEISICSTCFGILLLDRWVKTDAKLQNSTMIEEQTIQSIKRSIDEGLQLLIYLTDPIDGTWMSTWDRGTYLTGTINQTTLSLSTLFVCGFLDDIIEQIKMNPKSTKIRKTLLTQLENRFKYIANSIYWLTKNKIKYNSVYGNRYGWGYVEGNNEPKLLLTTFCFDIYNKFQVAILKILQLKGLSNGFYSMLIDQLEKSVQIMEGICLFYMKEIGENPKCVHLALIAKPFSKYLAVKDDIYRYMTEDALKHRLPEFVRMQKKLMDRIAEMNAICIEKLSEYSVEKVFHLDNEEYFEQFIREDIIEDDSQENSQGYYQNAYSILGSETYECCTEVIFADALIQNAFFYRKNGNMEMAKEAITKCREIIERFNTERICGTEKQILSVKGRRNQYPNYPIYMLYYYRMLIYDYIDFFKRTGCED